MMDPRDQDEGNAGLPLNLEAEHALLGILMYANEAHRQVHDLITAEDFAEPFHKRLYAAVVEKIVAGKLAEPTTLQTLDADPAYVEFGGIAYLLDLVDHAPPTNRIRDYAEQIADTAVRRRLIKMAAEAQSQARNPDVTGYAAVAMARAQLEEAERGAAPEDALFVNAWDAAQARMDRLELEVATGKPKGVQTGLSSIDKRLGGLLPGSVIVMAGRPGMGKTALLGNVLYGAALRNPNKLFAGFSLEMDTDQMNDRALSRLTVDEDQPVSFSDIAKVQPLTSFDLQALHRAKQSIPRNLWLRDRAGVSVEDVSRAVWAMKRRGDLAAIGIDYLQLMRRPALAGRNEASAIAEMTGALKTLAREAKIAIILLSQLNRSVESRDDKRPMLSDLRESGSIEQDADAVLFPFREVYYLQKAEPIRDLTRGVEFHRLEKAIRRGDLEDAIAALHIDRAAFHPLEAKLVEAFTAGGQGAVATMPAAVSIGFRFDPGNQRAAAIIRETAGSLITRLTQGEIDQARAFLVDGMARGAGPRSVALDLVGRISRATGNREGGLIGLSAPQRAFVESAKAELGSGDPALLRNYLARGRRDRTFDARVRAAIISRKPVPADVARTMTTRYAARLTQLRGEIIARTEGIPAIRAAKHEAFQQLVDDGRVDAMDIVRGWSTTTDGRQRDSHDAMNGQEVRGLDSPFVSPSGAMFRYPGDSSLGAAPAEIIACRCDEFIAIRKRLPL